MTSSKETIKAYAKNFKKEMKELLGRYNARVTVDLQVMIVKIRHKQEEKTIILGKELAVDMNGWYDE